MAVGWTTPLQLLLDRRLVSSPPRPDARRSLHPMASLSRSNLLHIANCGSLNFAADRQAACGRLHIAMCRPVLTAGKLIGPPYVPSCAHCRQTDRPSICAVLCSLQAHRSALHMCRPVLTTGTLIGPPYVPSCAQYRHTDRPSICAVLCSLQAQ